MFQPWGIELTIKNYRCFPDHNPAKLRLRNGFVALVGPNNAGKSSILRFLYEFRPLFAQLVPSNSAFTYLCSRDGYPIQLQGLVDQSSVFTDGNSRGINISVSVDPPPHLVADGDSADMVVISAIEVSVDREGAMRTRVRLPNGLNEAMGASIGYRQDQPGRFQVGNRLVNFEPIVWAMGVLRNAMYVGAYRNALNRGSTEYYDINIGEAFIADWDNYKSGPIRQHNQAAVRLTYDIQRIFGYNALEINSASDNSTLQVIVNNSESYRLDEMGAGIAQFILVLAVAAVHRPSLILIDEPELNLHPSLQLDFLTTLASFAQDGVVFATHSLGLARAASDAIYSVRRVSHGESEVKDFDGMTNLAELTGELSFAGYRELGFDRVLLVEGPTEVRAMQQLLRRYRADHSTVVIPLGGAGMVNGAREQELAELRRISDNIGAIVDSEKHSKNAKLPADRSAFRRVCNKQGIECHVLERRAFENYLTERAIKVALGPAYRGLDKYEKLSELYPRWSKSSNWLIARELTQEELGATDLGQFLSAFCTKAEPSS